MSSFDTASFVLFDLAFFRVNIKTNMAAYGLKNARDSILYGYAEDFIDDIEFFLLYDSSYPREVYPYI